MHNSALLESLFHHSGILVFLVRLSLLAESRCSLLALHIISLGNIIHGGTQSTDSKVW